MTNRLLLSCSVLVLTAFLCFPVLAQDDDPQQGYGNVATAYETRLSAVEDQLRALTGKIEQIEYMARRLEQSMARLQADYDARLTRLEQAPPPAMTGQRSPAPTEVLGGEEDQPQPQEPVVGTLGGMRVNGNKVTGAVINPQSPPLPDKPADYGLTAQEHYDMAFGLLRQADYVEAEKMFKKFIEKFGKDPLLDNAKYWFAETFYVRGKYGDAAIAFADAYQQNPKGNKAPDSLLKLAMSLAAMDKKQDACDALTALKAKYPRAAPTIRSRTEQERSRLKCK